MHPAQFPLRDFFASPERAYFRLSDDGKTLGFMQPVAEGGGQRRLNVFVQTLDGSQPVGEPRLLTHETARDINLYYWKGSDRILYDKDFGGDENFHVVSVDVASGKITDLTPGEKVRAQILDDLPDDPDHILVQHNRRNRRGLRRLSHRPAYRRRDAGGEESRATSSAGRPTTPAACAWRCDPRG